MNKVNNKSSTACKDLEARAIKKELRHTIRNYSKVIDMIDATLQFEEPISRTKESHSWKKRLKMIFKHFKTK